MEGLGTFYMGQVTHVLDPSNFWMRVGTGKDFDNYSEYLSQLNTFLNETSLNENCDISKIMPEDTVVVAEEVKSGDTHQMRSWRRAQVANINVSSETVDVFYIDQGFTEIVGIDRVRVVSQELLTYLPPFVARYELIGIKPLTKMWTSRGISTFKKLVIGKKVAVCFFQTEGPDADKKVLLFSQDYDDATEQWISVTHYLINEEVGIPFGSVWEESLTSDFVREAFAYTELLLASMKADPLQSENVSEVEQGINGIEKTESEQQPMSEVLPPDCSKCDSNQLQLHLPSPADFTVPATEEEGSLDGSSTMSPVTIPPFDLSALQWTRQLSISKMQEDMMSEIREQTRNQLERELQDVDDNEEELEIDHDWGASDLLIGKPMAALDPHEKISQELYQGYQPDTERLDPLLTEILEPHLKSDVSKAKAAPESEVEKVKTKMTEEEKYRLDQKICKILSNPTNEDPELVCALVNSDVEPDPDIDPDLLSVVLVAVLEWMVFNVSEPVSTEMALLIVGTYSTIPSFADELVVALKQLKDKFVKVSQSIRISGNHIKFAHLLALIFQHAETWSPSVCSRVQNFILSTLEAWTIFNKHRQQDRVITLDTELMFLECVEQFLHLSNVLMVEMYPKKLSELMAELTHKLLHDHTNRSVRVRVLDIILHNQTGGAVSHHKATTIDATTQTEESASVSVEEFRNQRGERNPQPGFYRPPRGFFLPRKDPYTPHVFPSDPAAKNDQDTCSLDQNESQLLVLASDFNSNAIADSNKPTMQHPQKDLCHNVHQETIQHSNRKKKGFPKSLRQLPQEFLKKYLKEQEVPGFDKNDNTSNEAELEMEQSEKHKSSVSVMNNENIDSINRLTLADAELSTVSDKDNESNKKQTVEPYCSDSQPDVTLEEQVPKLPVIRYTTCELKAMNPNQGEEPCEYVEPYELKALFPRITAHTQSTPSPNAAVREVKKDGSTKLKQRYSELRQSEPPLLSTGPGSNFAQWTKLSSLLPESKLEQYKISVAETVGSSVDPRPDVRKKLIVDKKSTLPANVEKDVLEKFDSEIFADSFNAEVMEENTQLSTEILGQEKHAPNFVEDREGYLQSNSPLSLVNPCIGAVQKEEPSEPIQPSKSQVEADDTEIWHQPAPAWTDNYFVSVKAVDNSEANSAGAEGGRKGKKKKTKFRPINLFKPTVPSPFVEEESFSGHSERPRGKKDELGFESDEQEDSDEFSESNLQMYVELEEEEKRKEKIIHPPRLGVTSGERTRTSIFADLRRRQEQSQPLRRPWEPKKRCCTRCGSEEHIVYDCPEKGSILFGCDEEYY